MWADGLKGIKSYQINGIWYHYDRHTGKKIEAERGTSAFKKTVLEIRGKAKPEDFYGTLAGGILLYKENERWTGLRASTQRDYQKVITWLEAIDERPIIEFTDKAMAMAMKDAAKEKGYRFANKMLTILKLIMDCAEEAGWINGHRLTDLSYAKRPRELPDRNKPWEVAECRAMLESASPTVLVPLALCMWLGFRIGDALTVSRKDYDGMTIRKNTNKRNVYVSIPVPAPLKRILDSAPTGNATTLAVKRDGTPWSYGGYQERFRELRAKLHKRGLVRSDITLHGCRHTVATILREDGYGAEQVAQFLAQTDETMPLMYGKNARLEAVTGPMAKVVSMKIFGEA